MAFAAAPYGGYAQGIVDPTRPPGILAGPENADDAVRGPVLQSIMIKPNARSAIISGQRVELGGKYGDARVTAIGENEVVLRSENGTDVLKLYPDVHMKTAKGAVRTARKPRRERN
jgi:hypothetical protein